MKKEKIKTASDVVLSPSLSSAKQYLAVLRVLFPELHSSMCQTIRGTFPTLTESVLTNSSLKLIYK